MSEFDVVVIGGGPAGFAAAVRAAEAGANVALIEAEKPGGACVHYACMPTSMMLSAATTHLEARELAALQLFDAGERFNFARATARTAHLVGLIAEGMKRSLRAHKVSLIDGRAAFSDAHFIDILGGSGTSRVGAESFVVATGTRWEPPSLPGVPPERVLTADGVLALISPPASALVLGGGPGQSTFALEYAALLALSGAEVTLVTPEAEFVPGLDGELLDLAAGAYGDLGIEVLRGWTFDEGMSETSVVVRAGERRNVPSSVVVVPDVRRPFFGSLNLRRPGVVTEDRVIVDRACRTNVANIFAAGDVTGGPMVSSVATHMGQVAGTNAAGGDASTRLAGIPHLVHGPTQVAWAGATEADARARGASVAVGMVDLGHNPRAVGAGARRGGLKLVVDRSLGEVLGAHAVGPGACEIITLAAALMQAEVSAHDLAAMVLWHPTMSESLPEAARQALSAPA